MSGGSAPKIQLRRDRLVVLASLAGVTALAWCYLLWLARNMSGMPMDDMPGMDMAAMNFAAWTFAHFVFMFAMWTVMMVGMMLPSVAPTLLLYAGVARNSRAHPRPLAPVAWFAAGYVLAWCLFSLCATLMQWGLEALAQLTPMLRIESRRLGGAMLIGIGAYQWLPFKQACLSNCRSPLSFIQNAGGFQASVPGSIRLGLLHGLYCIGCCWALMLLLFVVGVMNLLWIAALMIVVLLEKLLPSGPHVTRLLGTAALMAGVGFLL